MIFSFLVHTEKAFRNFRRTTRLNQIKILLAISLIGIAACDEIPNDTIIQEFAEIRISKIEAPQRFEYSVSASTFTVSVQFEDSQYIEEAWLSIKSVDGSITLIEKSELRDDGNEQNSGDSKNNDNIYSAKIPMKAKDISGKYNIDFYATENIMHQNIKVGAHIFEYINGQYNLPPVISDLNIPLEVARDVSFIFSIKANDPNGQNDIYQVYFKLSRPDGTAVDPQNGYNYFLMDDTGDEILGDSVAGDGIYSFKNSFGPTSQTGKWRFEFQAKDRNGLASNTIIHELTVN